MSKTILLIEDNPDVRENTAEILGLAGYKVITAENGKVGVEKARSADPDLIICDIMMPELEGYGVLMMIGKDPKTASIPFIFLTAKTEKSDIRKGMNMGADDYITKPFDEVELLEAIETRLKKSQMVKAEFDRTVEGFDKFIETARGLEELRDLPKDRKVRHYSKKDMIFFEGDEPQAVYFLVEGKIKTTKTDEYQKELVIDIYEKGDFFGYIPILEDDVYKETASAIEDSSVSVIPKDAFLWLIQRNRDVAVKFMKMLSNNITEKEERLLRLAYGTVRERTAEALLSLMSKSDRNEINVSREDLASIVGTATESLIRMLSEFRNDGYISIEGRRISIEQPEKLERLIMRSGQ
jgi:CRP/FNR family transcriptional regulator, polysaccharide utilization system transcription regulator